MIVASAVATLALTLLDDIPAFYALVGFVLLASGGLFLLREVPTWFEGVGGGRRSVRVEFNRRVWLDQLYDQDARRLSKVLVPLRRKVTLSLSPTNTQHIDFEMQIFNGAIQSIQVEKELDGNVVVDGRQMSGRLQVMSAPNLTHGQQGELRVRWWVTEPDVRYLTGRAGRRISCSFETVSVRFRNASFGGDQYRHGFKLQDFTFALPTDLETGTSIRPE